MSIAYTAVTIVTVLANAGVAIGDLVRAPSVLATSAAVGVSPRYVPVLGVLKAAGAAGLVLGLLGARWIAVAAAAGLVLFFVGAIVVHVRARVLYNVAVPACYLALAVGSLLAAIQQ
ncbi:MAG: hypothetical protein QOK02_3961 [Mycobacterium sp.]|jgi:hypothetical protein|nr:hypothetical protein [Mycobacterium sp.]